MIRIKDIQKSYSNRVVLCIPELNIPEGEAFGIVGNNGAGKTTLLSLILDLRKADRGNILIEGNDVTTTDAWKKTTGSYLNETFLIPFLTPREFFKFVGQLHNLNELDINERIAPYEDFLGLEILGEQRFIRNLSKGNQMKTGIMAALISHPSVLILDEPFSGLDPSSQIRLKQILKDINRNHRTTLLISSHDLSHVTDVCSRIAILDCGNLVKDSKTSETTLADLQTYFAV